MQKIITIAALLAAGTVFANAEIILLETDFTSYANLDAAKADGWSQSKRNEAGGSSHGNDLVISPADGLQNSGWSQSTFEHALNSSINLDANGSYAITFETKKPGNNVAQQFALTSDAFSLVVGTSYETDSGVYVGSVSEVDVLSSSSWYTFQTASTGTAQIEKGSTISSSALANGVFLTYALTLNTRTDENDELIVSIKNGDSEVASGTYSFSGTGVLSSAGFMLEGGSSVSFKNLTVSSSSIPEPSAFGLLAGAGALALVAARRRRAK